MIQRLDSVWRTGLRPGSLPAFGFATLCFFFAMSVRTALTAFDGDISPFRAYFPAILIVTLVGGERAGILVLLLGLIAGWDGMMDPFFSLQAPNLPQSVDILFYIVTSAAIVFIAESYRRMLRGESGQDDLSRPLIKQVAGALVPEPPKVRARPKRPQPHPPAAEAPQASQDKQRVLPAQTDDLVARYSKQLYEAFSSLIPRDRPVVLIGGKGSLDNGDLTNWLGEKELLSQLGITPSYRCSADTYDRVKMAACLQDGTILMQGGENFRDANMNDYEFRMQVLRDFTGNKAIMFPQQVTFLDNANLRRTAAALAKHPDLTLFSGSVVAHHLMKQHFGATAKVRMAPDMAFMLGRQTAVRAPAYDVAWLSRTGWGKPAGRNAEALMGLASMPEEDVVLPGSRNGEASRLRAKCNSHVIMVADMPGLGSMNNDAPSQTENLALDANAKNYLERALFTFSLGHIAITDSLHGHILCLLMGKPHIFLNNDTGKNWDFYDTWTRATPLCRFARNPVAAWTIAMSALPDAKELGPENIDKWPWN